MNKNHLRDDIVEYYYVTEKGLREHNEDYYIAEKINDLYVFGVADGIGGHSGGELASKIAIGELKEYIKRKGSDRIKEGFEKANSTIIIENKRRNSNMGTTLVLCIVKNEGFIVANVGDSRAYVFGEKNWRTKDHNLVQDLIQKGVIDKKEAIDHPQKNVVTRALGLDKKVKVDVYDKMEEISIILLCSDGLSDYVDDKIITEIVKKYKPKVACGKLVKKALENGSKDNITVVIVNLGS